jgi:hypothetical protein
MRTRRACICGRSGQSRCTKMLRRLRLQNFMSHQDTVIELAEGLTVLTGPNNCGKSAVVEALRVLCENPPSEVVVRHGEKLCRVTAETDDGHVLAWQRKSGVVSYEIDGRPVHRLGRNCVPDDLHKLLRLPRVELPGKDPVDVHIGQQKQPLFLLDRTESDIAAFFSASSDAARLLEMQQRHRQKVADAKTRQRQYKADLESTQRQLAQLAPLDQLGQEMERCEAEFGALRQGEETVQGLESLMDRMAATERTRGQFAGRLGRLAPLQTPPALEDESRVADLADNLEKHRGAVERFAAELKSLAGLTPPPLLDDEVPVVELGVRLRQLQREAGINERRVAVLRDLAGPPEIADTMAVEAAVEDMARRAQALATAAQQQSLAESALSEHRERLEQWVKEHPHCPLCGRELEAGILMADGGCEHG